MNIALISFTVDSLSVRLLSSYMKAKQHNVFILFISGEPDHKTAENVVSFLEEKKIGLIGISLVTDDFIKARIITEQIKRRLEIPVIWGGAHPSIKPEECLKFSDMVCVGEGEEAIAELVCSLEKKDENTNIKNIYFKKKNKIIYNDLRSLNKDLDSFPFQDIDFNNHFLISSKNGIENFREEFLGKRYNIICSRGCPFSCSYCYNNSRRKLYLGKGCYLRERSSDNVLLELEKAKNKLSSVKIINLWDDNFLNRSEEDLRKFSEKYKKLIKFPFFCLANPHYITEYYRREN